MFEKKCWRNVFMGRLKSVNESFNGTIWNRIPKATHVGLSTLCSWLYDAVSHFNYGQKAALDTIRLLDIDPGIYMTKSCGSINKKRKHQSIYKTLSQKKRRKILVHSSKKRNDKVVEQEGTSYEAGGFETFVLCLNCYIYIVGTPLLKKRQELLKFSSPGGWEIFC